MSELRRDLISGYSVLIAENRAARPQEFARPARRSADSCPFCRGQESQTPAAVAAYPHEADTAAWEVRVVPNKYPAVETTAVPGQDPSAVGVHEVIIESPHHVDSFSQVSDRQAELTMRAYRDRLLALRRERRLGHVLVFKNARAEGGASLEHTHSQLLATTTVPPVIQLESARAGEHRALHGSCIFCVLLAEEMAGQRAVVQSQNFTAFCPYASRFPYEMWLLPTEHQTAFEDLPATQLAELGVFLRGLLRRLESCLGTPAYNYWLHNPPLRRSRHDDYHWHIEIAPRLSQLAGYELGTGCFINPVAPEYAADRLRSARPASG